MEVQKPPLPAGSPFVGMPHLLKLNEFGALVSEAFGVVPCLVGSALKKKDWRDVDVRLILPDELYCRVFELHVEKAIELVQAGELHLDEERTPYAHVAHSHHNNNVYNDGRWVSLVRAFAALGSEMTGLPIDFQITSYFTAEQLYPAKSNHRMRLWGLKDRLAMNESSPYARMNR